MVFYDEVVELMPVDGQIAFAVCFPGVFLINRNAYQMRHHIRQAVIVIALNPYDFHAAFRVGEFSDEGEELPVLFFQAPEVEIAENVAQKNQAPEPDRAQQLKRLFGSRCFRPQMKVGEYNDIIPIRFHEADCFIGLLRPYKNRINFQLNLLEPTGEATCRGDEGVAGHTTWHGPGHPVGGMTDTLSGPF